MITIHISTLDELTRKAKATTADGLTITVRHTWAMNTTGGGMWYDETNGCWLNSGEFEVK